MKKSMLGAYLVFLIMTIPYVRFFQDYIKINKLTGLYDWLLVCIIVFLVACVGYNLFFKKMVRLRYLISYGITLFIFFLGMLAIGETVERVHFIEYGICVYLLFTVLKEHFHDLSLYIWIFLCSFAVGIADEWVQWFVPSRFGEFRDIYINLLATLFGLFCIHFLFRPSGIVLTLPRHRIRFLLWALMFLTIELGIFIQCAHLGFLVRDEHTGSFRSLFSQRTLLEHTQKRSYPVDMQIQPLSKQPIIPKQSLAVRLLVMWQKEDFYKTEAEFHCGERNRALDRQKFVQAYYENALLEKYYRPLIQDSPLRWSESKAAEVRKTAGIAAGGPSRYFSPVLNHYWTGVDWKAFWAVIAVLCALIMFLAKKVHTSTNGLSEKPN